MLGSLKYFIVYPDETPEISTIFMQSVQPAQVHHTVFL